MTRARNLGDLAGDQQITAHNNNIGIGTILPTQKLDVNGNIRIRSGLYDKFNNVGTAGSILVSSGVGVYWDSPTGAGAQGTQGIQGIQGAQGTQGIQGIQGTQGIQGIQGSGSDGSQGTQGTQGILGLQGIQGIQGLQGIQGVQGTQGIQGLEGTQGISGLKSLINNPKTSSYVLTIDDVGELINITTGGVTVPSSIFSAGDSITIYNNSANPQTITQGSSVTLRLAGTSLTGNRTLDQRGITTVMCVASNEFVISGAGLA